MHTVHLLAHTHWDREWYHPAERFRARLVAMVDALLARAPGDMAPFLLDGQAVVLSDYLAVRPDQTAALAAALRSGQLEAGPWYVLADNLMPSGEAIVRNLEAGRRLLQRLGASPPPVMYCPDTFGHPAALPAIAAGFGYDVAVVWRGFGGASFPATDTAWWVAAGGETVLLYHLPPDGYEYGSALPVTALAADDRWRAIRAVLSARNRTGHALLTVGADHHAPSPTLGASVALLADCARRDGATVTRVSLGEAAAALLRGARARTSLPTVHGELRDSYGYTWTLQGSFATRAAQKRRNARLERVLLRDVEVWQVLAWLHGGAAARAVADDGSLTLAQLPALTDRAWETLLLTHPHDTLCGCSTDAVAQAMDARQLEVASVVPELRDAAIALAMRNDRVAARAEAIVAHPTTVIRNRCAYPRGGVAEIRLLETLGDVRVGPGSGNTETRPLHAFGGRPDVEGCLVQSGPSRVRHVRRESPQHYPDDDLVREHRVVAWVPVVPAAGIIVLGAQSQEADAAADRSDAPPSPVTLEQVDGAVRMHNGTLRVVASRDGVRIVSRGARQRRDEEHDDERDDEHDDIHERTTSLTLVTQADAGDSYTASRRGEEELLELHAVHAGARGPLRASIRLHWRWARGSEHIRVETELLLDAGADHVRCDMRGWNGRHDHRLQFRWHTDVGEGNEQVNVLADAAFGPVDRSTRPAPIGHAIPPESPASTMPLHRWLSVYAADRGATVISDGLAEGEVGDGWIGVTLVRAIGELSRPSLPERPGHAGWPCPIPRAQSRGRFLARLGLVMHGPQDERSLVHIEGISDALLVPLVGESHRDRTVRPQQLVGPELRGDGLIASALRLDDATGHVTLRAVNITERPVRGAWRLPAGRFAWRQTRLDGTPGLHLDHVWVPVASDANGDVHFDAAPREIVTIQLRRIDSA